MPNLCLIEVGGIYASMSEKNRNCQKVGWETYHLNGN